MLPRKLQPGDEIHYVSLLDEQGNALRTLPMDSPIKVGVEEGADDLSVNVSLHVNYSVKGAAR